MSAATPGLNVLVTRAPEDAAATVAPLQALGFSPVLAPLSRIVPAPPIAAASANAIVVTSGNALPAIAALRRLPLLAVGDATAARARALGFADVRSAGGDAADLARLALAQVSGTVLLATGAGQGAGLAAAQRAGGLRVLRRVAYAARPVTRLPAPARAAVSSGELHAILFLSTAAAATFARVLPAALRPALAGVLAAAIAESAAAELRHLPFRQVRVSLRPTLNNTLALL